ncbi:MAG: murein L,D-transpeptidase YcbB/YkuD, partial [Crocinitomicaceae bacterium]
SGGSTGELTFEQEDIPVAQKLEKAITKDYLASLGMADSVVAYLHAFYSERKFAPVWINDSTLTEMGTKMKDAMSKPEQLGVPEGRHVQFKGTNYIQDELINTYMTALVANDLENGIIDYTKKTLKPSGLVDKGKLSAYTDFDDATDVRYQFVEVADVDSSYIVLSQGLINLMDTYPMDTSIFKVHSIKKDSTEAAKLANQALVSKGYLEAENDTSMFMTSLRTFQEQNGLKPDGVIGRYTSRALNESTTHRRDRIILALDKLRSHEKFPTKYIYINIPEYKLRFFINDSLKSDHNIVVGKDENQTPELTSNLKNIVTYPFWNVPYSISSKEILPAIKYNSEYLANHNYTIYKDGAAVDPSTVDWSKIGQSSFPYRVVQGSGRSNSLGIMKFVFPNSHSVYFHDTPSKSLFSTDVRAYSHGCMRTQNPVQLAEAILPRDNVGRRKNDVSLDSLASILDRGERRVIKLNDPIPIYIEYVTVARRGIKMITYIDIYGRDEEYLKIMRG